MGKLLLLVGAVGFLGSLFGMLKIKSLEGKTAMKPGPGAMKLVGAARAPAGMGHHAVRHAPDTEHRWAHRPRAGGNCGEPFRDHRHFARGLQQERGLEELECAGFVTAAKITHGAHTNEKNQKLVVSAFVFSPSAWRWAQRPTRRHRRRRLPRLPAPPFRLPTPNWQAAAAKAPATADLAKGDPGGTITGTINDVPAADSKAGVTLPDVANQVGQNKIAINFVWTLVTGFLVMFMQAGFAMVESGLCRVKNANHTYMMNFFVYTCGLVRLLAHRLRHTNGRRGRQRKPGRPAVSDRRTHHSRCSARRGDFSADPGMFLSGHTYDVGVMVIFLFEMVFMDTALTIVTGACAERWKFLAFAVSSSSSWARSPIRSTATGHGAAAGSRSSAPTSAWARAIATLPDRAWCTRSEE